MRRLRRIALATALVAGLPALAAEPVSEEVAIDAAGGKLHGTLLQPGDTTTPPTVLILPGSGPTDRDGNQPKLRNDSLKLLAEALARRGITSLRIDKRGVGASAPAGRQESELRFDDYVADVKLWLGFLHRRGGKPPFALGHSEGGLIASLAAESSDVAGLILLAAPGRPIGTLLRGQLEHAGLPPQEQARANGWIGTLERGQAIGQVPPEWMWLFRPSVQPYLISWLRHDPAAVLARTRVPALVIQGSTDIQTSVADAERLAASRSGVRLALIEEMNHVLKAAPPDRAANVATYADPTLPVHAELVDAVARFMHEAAR